MGEGSGRVGDGVGVGESVSGCGRECERVWEWDKEGRVRWGKVSRSGIWSGSEMGEGE